MRIAVLTGKAPSLLNLGRDIMYVAQSNRHVPRAIMYVMSATALSKLADGVILVYPASPLFCASFMLLYRDLRVHYNVPTVYYTMIEGRPRRVHVREWMIRDVEFIACSNYVKNKLEEVGFVVKSVIHHGLLRYQIEEAKKLSSTVKKQLRAKFPDKVIFGVLSHSHPRKGLEFLAKAVQILSKKRSDFLVYLVTNPEARRKIENTPNVYIDTRYGKRSRLEALAFEGAVDFLIIPSLAEGFGLPLIESNAMGVPVLHGDFPPLTEITNFSVNLIFPTEDVDYVNTGEGIEYEMHFYQPGELAECMETAIEMKLKYPSELKDRQAEAVKVINKFDAEKLYKKLLAMIGA